MTAISQNDLFALLGNELVCIESELIHITGLRQNIEQIEHSLKHSGYAIKDVRVACATDSSTTCTQDVVEQLVASPAYLVPVAGNKSFLGLSTGKPTLLLTSNPQAQMTSNQTTPATQILQQLDSYYRNLEQYQQRLSQDRLLVQHLLHFQDGENLDFVCRGDQGVQQCTADVIDSMIEKATDVLNSLQYVSSTTNHYILAYVQHPDDPTVATHIVKRPSNLNEQRVCRAAGTKAVVQALPAPMTVALPPPLPLTRPRVFTPPLLASPRPALIPPPITISPTTSETVSMPKPLVGVTPAQVSNLPMSPDLTPHAIPERIQASSLAQALQAQKLRLHRPGAGPPPLPPSNPIQQILARRAAIVPVTAQGTEEEEGDFGSETL